MLGWLFEAALLPKKLYLLVRYDVKQQLTSAWFYLILIGLGTLPPSWYACYPNNANVRVLMVDEIHTANFTTVLDAIRNEGFAVQECASLDIALQELLDFNATMVIHVAHNGEVNWYAATPRLKKLLTRAIQSTMLAEQNKAMDRYSRAGGRPTLKISLVAENHFANISKRDVSTATFMVRVTWYFASLISLTMFILAKPSLSKLLRIYSMPMLLSGKLLAGLACGCALVVLFLAQAYMLGFLIPNLTNYLVAFGLSVFSGVAFGCLCGGVPLALTNDVMGLVFAALMGLSLTFMGYAQLSAFLTPISNMDPMIYTINQINPLYNLNQFIYNCVFLGDLWHAAPNPEYLVKVVGEALGCLILALFFLLRL